MINGLREFRGGMDKFTEAFTASDDFHGGQIKGRVVFDAKVGARGLCGVV